jgi:hypothetical protein
LPRITPKDDNPSNTFYHRRAKEQKQTAPIQVPPSSEEDELSASMSRRTKATRKGESNSDLEVEKDTPKPKQSASKTYVKAATIELSEQTQKDDMAGSRS